MSYCLVFGTSSKILVLSSSTLCAFSIYGLFSWGKINIFQSSDARVSSEVLSCISAMFVLVLQTPDALRKNEFLQLIKNTSSLIGAWKCNFPAFLIMTDRPTNWPTDGHEGSSGSYTSNNQTHIDCVRKPGKWIKP